MDEHGGQHAVPAPRGPDERRVGRHAAVPEQPPLRGRPGPPHGGPAPIPGQRPPAEWRSPSPQVPYAGPRHAYTPPLPRGPQRRVPAWVLPATLSAVIVLASAAIAGIASVALDSTRGGPSSLAAGTGDQAFLGTLGGRPSFAQIPDDTLIDLGHGICAALEDGSTRGELVSDAVSAGFATRDARLLVDAANAAYCPAE